MLNPPMLEIWLYACLAAGPCESHRLAIQSNTGQDITKAADQFCKAFAPMVLEGWVQRHPGWEVKRWACGLPTRDA